jgi:hypothetical protein
MHDGGRYRDSAAECLLAPREARLLSCEASCMSTLDAAKIATQPRQRNIPDLLGAPRQPRVPIKKGMAGQNQ